MRLTLLGAAAAAIALPLATCSCSSEHLAASPVPAPLTQTEAMILAQNSLAQRGVPAGFFVNAVRTGDGYLVGYQTNFNAAQQPPKSSHLMLVRNSGVVDEVTFRADH